MFEATTFENKSSNQFMEAARIEGLASTKPVVALSELGETYIYRGVTVQPTQAIAHIIGRDPGQINLALRHLVRIGELTEGEDFFRLDHEQNLGFNELTGCESVGSMGVTLITLKAVNSLFDFVCDQELAGTKNLRILDDAASGGNPMRSRAAAMSKMPTKSPSGSVPSLADLGETFVFRDAFVVPSQFFAAFSGRPVCEVNRALKRVASTGRLTADEDFFCLTYGQATALGKLQFWHLVSNHGITLLTRKAVNALSHYFDDAASIELSDTVNSIATKVMNHASAQSSADGAVHIAERVASGVLECKSDIATLCRANDDDTLTAVQITTVDELIAQKMEEYHNAIVGSLIRRRIKERFFARPRLRTYKEVARRQFEAVKQLIVGWKPCPNEVTRYRL